MHFYRKEGRLGCIELHWRFVCLGGVEFGGGYLKQLHGMRSNYLLLINQELSDVIQLECML